MALPKAIKVGGSYYKGYELLVSAATGDYILDISLDVACAINSISITCDTYGAGDTYKLRHLTSDGNTSLAIIADTIYNPGAGISVGFDLPAIELMAKDEIMRLTYSNTAGVAIAIHVIVEFCGITKTN